MVLYNHRKGNGGKQNEEIQFKQDHEKSMGTGKKAGMTISSGLKKAWKEAKTVKEKFEKNVKIIKPGYDESCCSDSAYLYFSLWEKYGKSRVYINDYKRRTLAYIDRETKQITEYDLCGVSRKEYDAVVNTFFEKYEF